MSDRPTRTATFLFTDIEVSTRHWAEEPDSMRMALSKHDLRSGMQWKATGAGFSHRDVTVSLRSSTRRSAINAAVAAQQDLGLPVRNQ
jgi:hypothetical protein